LDARAGEAGERGLLFVHSGGAHSRWWSYIAPYFTPPRGIGGDLKQHPNGHFADLARARLASPEMN
jgi:hypothetical protein